MHLIIFFSLKSQINTKQPNFQNTFPKTIKESKPSKEKNFSFLSKTFDKNEKTEKNLYRGQVGIQNLGETCFINVILQMIYHINPIRDFFLMSLYRNGSNYDIQLANSIENLLMNLWNGDSKSISPFNFYDLLKEKMPNYANSQQNDAHDFLLSLLDQLYRGDNFNSKKQSDDKNIKYSIFDENLLGILRNTVECPDCKTSNVKFETFLTLSLPIPFENLKNVDEEENFEKFWETFYISEDLNQNFRVLYLNINLPDKTLKLLSLLNFKEYVKKEMKTSSQHDIVLVATNDKIIWNLFENDDEKIFEIYSKARRENHTLCFMEIKLDVAMSFNYFVCLSFSVLKRIQNIENEFFLTLPRILFINRKESLYKQLENYVCCLLKKLMNEPDPQESYLQLFEIKLRLFNLFENLNNTDICENCKKSICNCKSFVSDAYFFEKEKQYENSTSKLFIKIVFLAKNTQEEKMENILLLKKSIKCSQTKEINLIDCFNEFTKNETLSAENKWLCPKCKETKMGKNQTELFSTPKFLIVQLKRFITQNLSKKKLGMTVFYPLEDLNLSSLVLSDLNYLDLLEKVTNRENFSESLLKISEQNLHKSNKDENEINYKLIGVINHLGNTLEKGHYYAYFQENGLWYKFDDRSVTLESEENICSPQAYLLVYEKIKKNK